MRRPPRPGERPEPSGTPQRPSRFPRFDIHPFRGKGTARRGSGGRADSRGSLLTYLVEKEPRNSWGAGRDWALGGSTAGDGCVGSRWPLLASAQRRPARGRSRSPGLPRAETGPTTNALGVLRNHVIQVDARHFRDLHWPSPPPLSQPSGSSRRQASRGVEPRLPVGGLSARGPVDIHRELHKPRDHLRRSLGTRPTTASKGPIPIPGDGGPRPAPPMERSRRSCRPCSSSRHAPLSRSSLALTPSPVSAQRGSPGGGRILKKPRVSTRC